MGIVWIQIAVNAPARSPNPQPMSRTASTCTARSELVISE